MPEYDSSSPENYGFIIDEIESERDEERGYTISFSVHGLNSPEDVISFYEESLKGWVDGLQIKGDNENGYSITAALSGFKMPGQAVNFYNQHLRNNSRERSLPIFGNINKEKAQEELFRMKTSAVFEREASGRESAWAIDAYEAIRRFETSNEDRYEQAVNNIAAVTLASIALAEGAERNSGGFKFYRDIIDEVASYTEPVTIDVEEEDTSTSTPVEPDVKDQRENAIVPLEDEESEEEIPFEEEVIEDIGLDEEALEPEDKESVRESVYQNILSENVDDAREILDKIGKPDYDTLLEKEKEGKDRVTITRYLERRKTDEEKSGSGDRDPEN